MHPSSDSRFIHASCPCIHPAVLACFASMHLCTFQRFSLLRNFACFASSDFRCMHPTGDFRLLCIWTHSDCASNSCDVRSSCFSCIHLQAQRLRSMLICDSRLIHVPCIYAQRLRCILPLHPYAQRLRCLFTWSRSYFSSKILHWPWQLQSRPEWPWFANS